MRRLLRRRYAVVTAFRVRLGNTSYRPLDNPPRFWTKAGADRHLRYCRRIMGSSPHLWFYVTKEGRK